MSQLPTRADLDDRHKWDLSTIFESPDEWKRELTAVRDRLEHLRENEARVARDGKTLLQILQLFEEVLRRTQRLDLYAQLKRDEDTRNSAHRERLHKFNQLEAEVTKITDMVRREIRAAGRDAIMQNVETTDGLEVYEHFLDDVLRMSRHARASDVEELLADFTEAIESPNRIYTVLTNNDIQPQPVEDSEGEQVGVTRANLNSHLHDRDRAFRRRAYRSVYEAYADVEHTIGTAYADKVKAQVALADPETMIRSAGWRSTRRVILKPASTSTFRLTFTTH